MRTKIIALAVKTSFISNERWQYLGCWCAGSSALHGGPGSALGDDVFRRHDEGRVDVDGDVGPVRVGGAVLVGHDALVATSVAVRQVGQLKL